MPCIWKLGPKSAYLPFFVLFLYPLFFLGVRGGGGGGGRGVTFRSSILGFKSRELVQCFYWFLNMKPSSFITLVTAYPLRVYCLKVAMCWML